MHKLNLSKSPFIFNKFFFTFSIEFKYAGPVRNQKLVWSKPLESFGMKFQLNVIAPEFYFNYFQPNLKCHVFVLACLSPSPLWKLYCTNQLCVYSFLETTWSSQSFWNDFGKSLGKLKHQNKSLERDYYLEKTNCYRMHYLYKFVFCFTYIFFDYIQVTPHC